MSVEPDPVVRFDGEPWPDYALRLERRIKEQRDHIKSLLALRADAGNRADRKKIAMLMTALGRMTLLWERERECRQGLVAALRRERNQTAGKS